MACFKLGVDVMEKKLGVLSAPEKTKEALAMYVREHLDDEVERAKVLPLTGPGRTTEAVSADIVLVIAGAKCAASPVTLTPLPEEKTQQANADWIEANVPKGLIKQRGEGRSVEAVFKDMACFKLGVDVMEKKLGVLSAPEKTKEALAMYVREHLDDEVERAKVLPLTGPGRTTEAVSADIVLVIAGAKVAAARASYCRA